MKIYSAKLEIILTLVQGNQHTEVNAYTKENAQLNKCYIYSAIIYSLDKF